MKDQPCFTRQLFEANLTEICDVCRVGLTFILPLQMDLKVFKVTFHALSKGSQLVEQAKRSWCLVDLANHNKT